MAHMDRVSICDLYGVQILNYDYKRVRAPQTSFHLLGRRQDAMRQWLKQRLSELLYARTRL